MARVGRRTGLFLLALGVAAGAAMLIALRSGEPAATPGQDDATASETAPALRPGARARSVPGGEALLPNMRSLHAEDLQVERVPGGRLLRFSAALANVGPGPLLLQPELADAGCPAGQHRATQVVHRDANDDGAFQLEIDAPVRARAAGCMLSHPTHDHWHFDAMASYSLSASASASGQRLAARRKVSFCLRDNRRVAGVGTDVQREHFGECSRSASQGISPGWADVYVADLPGQTLPLPPGRGVRTLCLTLAADPRGLLTETDETDNGRTTTVVVDGDRIRRGPPRRCAPS